MVDPVFHEPSRTIWTRRPIPRRREFDACAGRAKRGPSSERALRRATFRLPGLLAGLGGFVGRRALGPQRSRAGATAWPKCPLSHAAARAATAAPDAHLRTGAML
eukprot:scaffold37085_cov57-Phaeocystis_antarctica.AAC.3